MSYLEKEFDRVWSELHKVGHGERTSGKWVKEYTTGTLPENVRVERLRMDFEAHISDPEHYDWDADPLLDYGKVNCLIDLDELIVNGDQNSNDALLKSFDGVKKRGQEPKKSVFRRQRITVSLSQEKNK